MLSDQVSYQEGAVVSREILAKPTGTITIFAFDSGQGLSEHKALYDAFVLILDGEGEIWFLGKAHNLKTGESIIIPANSPHKVYAVTKFKMLLVMIKS